MVQIRCLKCKQVFGIEKEQMNKIDEISIGQLGAAEYLEFFPLISGRCGDKIGTKHAFVYTDEFMEEKKQTIQSYDNCNKNIVDLKKELDNISETNNKLLQEKEQINNRLEEIRNIMYTNDQKTNNMSLEAIPEKEKQMVELLDKFEEITGIRNIDMWR